MEFGEFEYVEDVRCGSQCGSFDYLNLCCWKSWYNKQEGDFCDYGLVDADGVIMTQKEFEESQLK